MSSTDDQPHVRHIAVCAFPFGTHATPLLLLVKRLATAAPNVRFTFFNIERSNDSLFNAIDVSNLPNIVTYNILIANEEHGTGGNPMKAIELFLELSPESFRRAMVEVEAQVGMNISCLITDAFLWFCADIAEERGSQWISLWTANTSSLSAHVHTDIIRSKFGEVQGSEGGEDPLIDYVPGLSSIHISDLPIGVATGDLNSPFSQMLHKVGLTVPKAKAVISNDFEELSPIVINDLKSKLTLLCVGPFPLVCPFEVKSDQYNCLEWLDKQAPNSVAYISFGTVATLPPHEIEALAKALEVSEIPFLWSMKDSCKPCLPPSFLERINNDTKFGLIVPWAPQIKVLSHPSVGVFVTHCGWNSAMESIVMGVPLICRPMIGDQMLNQRVIECDYKFGTGIEGGVFTQSGVTNALHQVMASDEGKQMRKNVEALKVLAEQSIIPSGSSYEDLNTLIGLIINA